MGERRFAARFSVRALCERRREKGLRAGMKRILRHRNARWLPLAASVAALLLLAPTAALASVRLPTAATGKVTNAHGTTVELNGTVDPKGIAGVTYYFRFGPTTTLASQTPALPVAPTTGAVPDTAVKVGQEVGGVLDGYHYRIYATWPAGSTSTGQTYPAGTAEGREEEYTTIKSSALKVELEHGKEAELSTAYEGSIELAGRLIGTGAGDRSVTLEQTPFPYTSAFVALGAPLVSTSSGLFTFRIPDMTHNLEVRVIASGTRPVYSRTVSVSVTPKVVLHMREGGKTDLFRLYGTSEPAKPGAEVIIQRLMPRSAKSKGSGPVAHTVGTTVLKRYTHKLSRFSIILAVSGTYHYRAYVSLPRGSLSSGHSNDVLIRSPRSATSGKAGGG
jgi:hypothetical protein